MRDDTHRRRSQDRKMKTQTVHRQVLQKSIASFSFNEATMGEQQFRTDEERWQAVLCRDSAADGLFFYAVRTTGIYCRTVCPARRGHRKNVLFFDSSSQAEAVGFQPCLRCRPNDVGIQQGQADIIARICRLIENSDQALSLKELAAGSGLSTSYLCRIFKQQTGVTPAEYMRAKREKKVRSELLKSQSITQAIYQSGYSSRGRFYENSAKTLGMTPQRDRNGGTGLTVRFAVGECWLGTILVAATEQGICAVWLGSDPQSLLDELQRQYSNATILGGDSTFETWVAQIVGFISDPGSGLDLPFDIRGTAFQIQVWNALREIPVGTTVTYSEIAEKIGRADAVRAVASACAANSVAVIIPCHRVVRIGRALAGYRWGIERKKGLLQHEKALDARPRQP